MTTKLTTFERALIQMRIASRWACALAIGGAAIYSVATEVPDGTEVKKVDLSHAKHETVLCYQKATSKGPYLDKPDPRPEHNPVQVVNGGVSWEGSCFELAANGQIRAVPGICHWLRSADAPCGEKP